MAPPRRRSGRRGLRPARGSAAWPHAFCRRRQPSSSAVRLPKPPCKRRIALEEGFGVPGFFGIGANRYPMTILASFEIARCRRFETQPGLMRAIWLRSAFQACANCHGCPFAPTWRRRSGGEPSHRLFATSISPVPSARPRCSRVPADRSACCCRNNLFSPRLLLIRRHFLPASRLPHRNQCHKN